MKRIAALALVTPVLVAPVVATPAHAATPAAVVSSAPTEFVVAVPLDTGGVHAAATKKVSIKTQKQQKYYWCSPAAGRALLSRFITRGLPSQKTIAKYMGTKAPNGTSREGLRNGLRKALQTYASGEHAVVPLRPGSQKSFLTTVQSAVGKKKAPLIYRVYAGYKPWGSHRNDKTGHSMVIYGYTTGSSPKILWWDPADNTRHTASLSKSWAAVKKAGRYGQGAYRM